MKDIDSTGAHFVHVPGWVDGWMEVKAVLRIAVIIKHFDPHLNNFCGLPFHR
jgi:hypothetical protein